MDLVHAPVAGGQPRPLAQASHASPSSTSTSSLAGAASTSPASTQGVATGIAPKSTQISSPGSGSAAVAPATAAGPSASGSAPGTASGSQSKPPPPPPAAGTKTTPTIRKKRLSCSECFRRKQRCVPPFPCINCRNRGVADQCRPPPPIPSSNGANRNQHQQPRRPINGRTNSSDAQAQRQVRFQDNDKKRRRSETEEDSAPSGQHDYYDDDEYDEYEYEYTDGSDEGQDAEQSTSSVAVAQQPEPLPKIMKRPRAGTGSSATSFVGDAGGRAPEYVNQDIGYQGPGALDAVSNLSGLTRSTGMSPRSLEWNALMGRPHPSHIQEELRLILGPYPNLETRMGYCQLFLDRFNWARHPIDEQHARQACSIDFQLSPDHASVTERLPLLALALAIMSVGSMESPQQGLNVKVHSEHLFFLCRKTLTLCEFLGKCDINSCWAHWIAVRYLDIRRASRACWHAVGAWIRHCLDVGLHHREPLEGETSIETAKRHAFWYYVLFNELEWSFIFARPAYFNPSLLIEVQRESLDFLDFAEREFQLARNAFVPCFRALDEAFTWSKNRRRHTDGTTKIEKADQSMQRWANALPSILRFPPYAPVDNKLDAFFPKLRFYRHVLTGLHHLHRGLLHRPNLFALFESQLSVPETDPIRTSATICIQTATEDMRAQRLAAAQLNDDEKGQAYAAGNLPYHTATVLLLGLILDSKGGKCIAEEDLREKFAFISDVARDNLRFSQAPLAGHTPRFLDVLQGLVGKLGSTNEEHMAQHSGHTSPQQCSASSVLPALINEFERIFDDDQQPSTAAGGVPGLTPWDSFMSGGSGGGGDSLNLAPAMNDFNDDPDAWLALLNGIVGSA
ncbi:hypothetical protein BDZ90DRAFT_232794 [Jaminaea rosea]|uniref:Zn(2)-C6 fungal-type domain-containing protein n=1 Tax=Jaminaea rosea TaxID=1569628 RepID=A0A316UMY3_9BASI|nr:hypothetical protein BDZ90DRAFT_232794 [Jaminaea rosea]PWN26662.1 hypothetical protein BDZ90DRAFT_232794 [Jaminaea rosea]